MLCVVVCGTYLPVCTVPVVEQYDEKTFLVAEAS